MFGGLGLHGQPGGSFVSNIFEDSCTEEGMVPGKAVLEGSFEVAVSETRKRFYITASEV